MADRETRTTELLADIQSGNSEAIEELFRRYYDRVTRIVRRQLGAGLREKVESADLVQETFATAQKKLPEFELREGSSLVNWFAKLSERRIHAAVEYYAAAKRDRGRENSLDAIQNDADSGDHPLQLAGQGAGPAEICCTNEDVGTLHEMLMELGEEQREVIMLRDFGQGSWESIATAMDRPSANAVRALHARAITNLTLRMCRRGGDPQS
ncbi:MAG: sigma-70 family RNA polymerase sigma factor [bacterium]|nr:sigma-70 family RNA polymerase sigma factor [bacterium]